MRSPGLTGWNRNAIPGWPDEWPADRLNELALVCGGTVVATRKSVQKPIYSNLAITIDSFNIRIHAGINHKMHDLRHAGATTRVYSHCGQIELMGRCHYPEEKAGQSYRIDIYGEELRFGDFAKTLADVHVRDKYGQPKYRRRGDNYFPLYDPPDSIGFIDRTRGSQLWTACAWVPPGSVTDMMTVLPHMPTIYIAIQEVKFERRRKIRTITLQSIDPAED